MAGKHTWYDFNILKSVVCNLKCNLSWKIHKYIEIKQLLLEQPMGQRKNQKRIRKYHETNENKTQNTKTYGMQGKQC